MIIYEYFKLTYPWKEHEFMAKKNNLKGKRRYIFAVILGIQINIF